MVNDLHGQWSQTPCASASSSLVWLNFKCASSGTFHCFFASPFSSREKSVFFHLFFHTPAVIQKLWRCFDLPAVCVRVCVTSAPQSVLPLTDDLSASNLLSDHRQFRLAIDSDQWESTEGGTYLALALIRIGGNEASRANLLIFINL